jgi:hypothetical protein
MRRREAAGGSLLRPGDRLWFRLRPRHRRLLGPRCGRPWRGLPAGGRGMLGTG